MDNTVIRRAGLKDVPAIVGMWKSFMEEHDSRIATGNSRAVAYLSKKKNANSHFREFAGRMIRSVNATINVAESGGLLAGYSLLQIKKNIPIFKAGKPGYISDLYVIRKFRGNGISSGFLREAVKWFSSMGIKHMSLKVHPENREAHEI